MPLGNSRRAARSRACQRARRWLSSERALFRAFPRPTSLQTRWLSALVTRPLTLEQASPVELCCDRGVQVPTTADGSHRRRARANRAICGRAFEWRHSERYKAISAEHRHDSKRHHILQEQSWESGATVEFRGDTSVIQGGWELAGQAAPVPRGDELAPLNFTVLCHGRASVPLRPADLA